MAARKTVTLRALVSIAALGAALAVGAAAVPRRDGAEAPAKHQTPVAKIEELIAQLGSPRYAVREAGTHALLKLGAAAVPFLEKSRHSTDPEVQARSSWLLDQISAESRKRILRRLVGGGIDQYVERLVRKQQQTTDADWADVALLAQWASFTGEPLRPRGVRLSIPRGDTTHFLKFHVVVADEYEGNDRPQMGRGGISCAKVIARTIKGRTAYNSFLICTGTAQIADMSSCVLFANGDVKIGYHLWSSVIVCDGAVEINYPLDDCIVIARGPVKVGNCQRSTVLAEGPVMVGMCDTSEIYAHGPVTITEWAKKSSVCSKGTITITGDLCRKNVLRAEGAVTVKTNSGDNIIEQNQPQAWPALPFQFFDPARLGIEVALVGDGLRVTAVAADQPFGRAGLKAGDVIVALDKIKPASVEAFRSQLRRTELEGRATLTVRRGEATLDVAVVFATKDKR